ncbi:MAG TPA: hypothetical protein VFW34_10615 [Candidatus Rubrimentiphilum sp.]|nr:hypothetical protein [Candidatus Rubrimentiphilum sp.]
MSDAIMHFRSEQDAGRIAKFISRKSIIEAGDSGLRWLIQRRIFNWTLVKLTMFSVEWNELSRVELRGAGDDARLRIIPRDPGRFKRNAQIQGPAGQANATYRIKSDAEGAIYITQGARARELYRVCAGYVHGDVRAEER